MTRGWLFPAILCFIAIALISGLTQFRSKIVVTHGDYTTTQTTKSDPIVTTGLSVSDTFCVGQSPCRVRAIAEISGLFPRDGVPLQFAVTGGIVIPFAAFCIAGFMLLRKVRGRSRMIVAWVLLAIAALMLAPFVILIFFYIRENRIHALTPDYLNSGFFLLYAATSIALLTGGIWLAARTHHARGVT